jgi:hypothetical protein
MKAKLQRYLQKTFGIRPPCILNNLNYPYSIGAQFHVRFELGGELANGTKERVEQATRRAVALFEETFANEEEAIWVLAYSYLGESLFGEDRGFLQQQFSGAQYAGFYKKLKTVYNASENKSKAKIIIGNIKVRSLKYKAILNAIANTEMGFKPRLNETVFFIGTRTNRIFYMYDDRGCLVESNAVNDIRELYLKRNEWIVDYHRPEIDKQFHESYER